MRNWIEIRCEPKIAAAALIWAKEHCPNYITNDAVIDPATFQTVYRFRFASNAEEEMTMFTLRWK